MSLHAGDPVLVEDDSTSPPVRWPGRVTLRYGVDRVDVQYAGYVEQFPLPSGRCGNRRLVPVSELEYVMLSSGLMSRIEESRAHPERLVPLDLGNLP